MGCEDGRVEGWGQGVKVGRGRDNQYGTLVKVIFFIL